MQPPTDAFSGLPHPHSRYYAGSLKARPGVPASDPLPNAPGLAQVRSNHAWLGRVPL